MSEFTIADYVKRYLELKDQKSAIENRHKMELSEINDALDTLESVFAMFLEQNGGQSIKTQYGTPYRSLITNFVADDKPTFIKWARQNHLDDVLDIRPSKSGLKDLLERNKEVHIDIPGIRIEQRYNINVRRS